MKVYIVCHECGRVSNGKRFRNPRKQEVKEVLTKQARVKLDICPMCFGRGMSGGRGAAVK